jgi:hypothetical protein
MIGKKRNTFYLKFSENWYYRNDIIRTSDGTRLRVLESPHKKWYKQLLQFITFCLYKAPHQYKVEIIK